MKRVGHLMERVVLFDNLQEAFLRAAREKSDRAEVIAFRRHLDDNLHRMAQQLAAGSYSFGDYRFFVVHDPKRRTICAAPFAHRVAFHALMRICHPVFDRFQIADSYASRIGRGQYKALERALYLSRRNAWYLKLDVCKYFDSISHEILLRQLAALFKDGLLLHLFRRLITGYSARPGKGLPIGNLTSQYFANHYLAPFDHYAKETLRLKAYVRYMDDILIFARTKDTLLQARDALRTYAEERLDLHFHPPLLNRMERGVPFLGYVVHHGGLRLSAGSCRRFRRKLASLQQQYVGQALDDDTYRQRLTSLYAVLEKAGTEGFRRSVHRQCGWLP